MNNQKRFNQYFTPVWAAELLLKRHFPGLEPGRDCILDPTCGAGHFLMPIPEEVQAFGVEIDPEQAQAARDNTGREIVTSDFLSAELPFKPSAIVGNPPFELKLFAQFLERCYDLLEYDQRAGFILPVYFFQTANTALKLFGDWSVSQELIPRNIFEGLEKPLCFATFSKERNPQLHGFFLYTQRAALESLKAEYRSMFVGNGARANVWRETIAAAIELCGGRASLDQLYKTIENNKPTANKFWREKIRQIAAMYFMRLEPGVYAQPIAA